MLLSVLYYSQVCRFSHQQRRPHYSGGEWHQGFAENKQEENRLQSPVFGGKKYKTMIYSFPQLVLRYFTCAHIIPPPYSRDSSFQRRSISKLDTGWTCATRWRETNTVWYLGNCHHSNKWGYRIWVLEWGSGGGGGIKRAGDDTHPSNGKWHIQAKHVALFYSTLISFSLCGCLLCFRVLEVLLQLYINWKSSIWINISAKIIYFFYTRM